MEAITIVLLLLVIVAASSAIARVAAAALPLPLIQIALGAGVALAFDFRVTIEPDVFLLLFIAPLLFLDGWRIPKEGLFTDRWTILALAFGLVLFTVIGAGFFIHWIIPAMPPAVAFALAAVLSPTDAVAVSAIAARTPMPKRLMHILEGESLLNDASGLVCMRFAVVAAVTGSFSIIEASKTFLWLAAGGAIVGVGVTVLANAAKDWISKHFGEETGAHILVSLLIPFGAYILADRLWASGILAAVAAGIAMAYEERTGRALAVTRIRRAAVWDAVQYAGNGVIFVVLGQQLPGIIEAAGLIVQEAGRDSELWLIVYILAISAALIVIRALWTWATLGLILFRAARRHESIAVPLGRVIAVTSLAGVRGAVTLSGVMTLPLMVQDGTAFPTRELAILLAAGAIIVSLVVANLALPPLLKGMTLPSKSTSPLAEDEARFAAAESAIKAIERHHENAAKDGPDADLYQQAGERIIALYQERIETRPKTIEEAHAARQLDQIELGLRLVALGAERDEYYRFARSGRLTDEVARRLVREVDLTESRYRIR